MKPTVIAVLVAVVLIGGAIVFIGGNKSATPTPLVNNVSVTDGKQIVEIGVKGGYSPQQSTAKADMPTVLRLKTDGTFDCSAGLVIPSLGIRQNLPSTGATDFQIPAQKAGTTLDGVCVMGMYHFSVGFN